MIDKKILEKIIIIFILIFGIYLIYSASITKMLGEDESRILYAKDFIFGEIYPKTFEESGQALFFYAILGIPLLLYNNPLVLGHVFTAMFTIFLLFIVYFFGKRVENIYYSIICIILLLSFPLLFHLSLIAYVDLQIAFFSILICYALIKFNKNKTLENLLFLTIFCAISFYVKRSGLILIFICFTYMFYIFLKNKETKFFILFILIISSIILPYIISNVLRFNYPNMEFLNLFFKFPLKEISWIKEATLKISYAIPSFLFFINTFGLIQTILLIFSFVYIFHEKKFDYILFFYIIFIFLLIFINHYIFKLGVLETRYLIIVFPQIAILNAYFLYTLFKRRKIVDIFVITIIIILIFSSIANTISTIDQTKKSVRFTDYYISALKWIKENTNKTDIIFTTYGGSTKIYAERNNIWAIEELREFMQSPNSEYVYETLKKYNVTYILIWSATIGREFIIPESNILGVYTPEFINTILQDTNHFQKVYENKETLIFKLK